MPPASMKNTMISPAATDLGLGSGLPTQVQDNLDEEMKKRKLLGMGSQSQVARDLGLSAVGTGVGLGF